MPKPVVLGIGFGPECRLHQSEEFAAVLAARCALRSRHFILNFAPNEMRGARLGLVVGRKHLKKAAERNLVKRVARESFRKLRQVLPAMDMVVRLVAVPVLSQRRTLRGELDVLLTRMVR